MINTILMVGFWAVFAILAGLVGFPWTFISRKIDLLYSMAMWGAWHGVRVAGVRVQVLGLNRLDPKRTYVFMSNHASLLDPPILVPLIPRRTSVLVKKELFRIPILAQAMRMGSLVPVDRTNRESAIASLRAAQQVLNAGINMTIFIEGTRSHDGRLLPFKKGPFYLAEESGVPIVPVTISGSHELMPKDKWQITPGIVTVHFHPRIEPCAYPDRDALMQAVREQIASGLPRELRESGATPASEAVSSHVEPDREKLQDEEAVKPVTPTTLRSCPRCGHPLSPDTNECVNCGVVAGRQYRRSTVIALWLICSAALFALASGVTRAYENKRDVLAQRWYERGVEALHAAQPEVAISDFRNALAYSTRDRRYRLQLAEALLAAGRTQEALDYFESLWQESPSDGRVNLALARLAAQRRDIPQTIRYYHGAIYGEWDQDPIQRRVDAQLELVKFLLQNGEKAQAQSELLALAQQAPNHPGLHMQIAQFFADAGDYDDALEENKKVLALEPDNPTALAEAGFAAFQLGLYRAAEQYLHKAVERNQYNQQANALLETLRLMARDNPYQRGLSSAERQQRAIRAFTQAGERLEFCAQQRGEKLQVEQPTSELQQLDAQWSDLSPGMNERMLRKQPDLVDTAMDLVFRIEERTKALCGQPAGVDEALLLIGENRQGDAE